MFVGRIIGGVIVVACILATSAMDGSSEYFRNSRGGYRVSTFKFEVDQEHNTIKDAFGSFFIQSFNSSLDKPRDEIKELKRQAEQKIEASKESLKNSSERFDLMYCSILNQEHEILEEQLKAFSKNESLLIETLRELCKTFVPRDGKEGFCWAVPNFDELKRKPFPDLKLDFSLSEGSNGAEIVGKSYIKLKIDGKISFSLFERLNYFFQQERLLRGNGLVLRTRTDELIRIKGELAAKVKELYEGKSYSVFGKSKFEIEREEQIDNLIDNANDIIQQLEPAYRMAQAIREFQKDWFEQIKAQSREAILKSFEEGRAEKKEKKGREEGVSLTTSFNSTTEPFTKNSLLEARTHQESVHSMEEKAEEKLEKKEEVRDDLSPEIFVEDNTQESSKRKFLLEEGARFLERGVFQLTKSGWLPPPDQRTWGDVASFYSSFRASQTQGDQRESELEKKQDDASREDDIKE